ISTINLAFCLLPERNSESKKPFLIEKAFPFKSINFTFAACVCLNSTFIVFPCRVLNFRLDQNPNLSLVKTKKQKI
ncbi:MAG: hypothetical protein L6416_02250, partial [Candidatus Omnitrophica bacterium]|nr:hypothetical protein [Candidatus Omnitrophota bacterium]